jgi:hypothetical protein
LFTVDPFQANGYFMLDNALCQSLGVQHVDIDIIVKVHRSNGSYVPRVVQSLHITAPDFYAHADQAMIGSLGPADLVFYQAQAKDKNGAPILEVGDCADCVQLCPGCTPLPAICHQICDGPGYSWALTAYSDQSQTVIGLGDGFGNNSYLYFYVRAADWGAFTTQFAPSAFGLVNYWSEFPWQGQDVEAHLEVIHVDEIPEGAQDYQGIPIVVGGPGYGVRKDRGPGAS